MKRLLLIVLTAVFAVTALIFTGCDCNGTENEPIEEEKPAEYTEVEGKFIVKDGTTNYKIVLPEDYSAVLYTASSELRTFTFEATGVKFEIVTENEISDGQKFVSLGKTAKFNATGVEVSDKELTSQGFKLFTKDENIYIAGGDYGVVFGVYKLLNMLFNYEYFAPNCYSLNKTTEVNLVETDVTEVPDIEYRVSGNARTYSNSSIDALRYGYVPQSVILYGGFHNGFDVLSKSIYLNEEDTENYHPSWYSVGGNQLCYTAHGDESELEKMIDTAAEYFILKIEAKENIKCVSFTIQDNMEVCTCSACNEVKQNYGGSNSAAVIKFCNKLYAKLAEKLKAKGIDRDIKIVYFAYNSYEDVPVKAENGGYTAIDDSVKCVGVIPYYCTMQSNINAFDYKHEKNKPCLEKLEQFKAISDEIWIWGYMANFNDYLIPFNGYGATTSNIKILKDYNCSLAWYQGAWNGGIDSHFGGLMEYLISKLMWDTTLDVNVLTAKYFKNVFGPASKTMYQLYKELRETLQYDQDVLGMKTSIYAADIISEDYFKNGTLLTWLDYIDKAYGEIEHLKFTDETRYNFYKSEIKKESIFVRYFYAKLYLTGDSVSNYEFKKSLVNDIRELGFKNLGEGGFTIQNLISDWGIN